MSERERFEQEFPLPRDSDISWHEDRQQYLTSTKMWKTTARGRTHALQGWQARARIEEQREAELVELLKRVKKAVEPEYAQLHWDINEALAKYKHEGEV